MEFFKYGVEIFNSNLKEYGGFNHFLAGKVFRWKFCYLIVSLEKKCKFDHIHNNESYYYDGYHNIIQFGYIAISYGT